VEGGGGVTDVGLGEREEVGGGEEGVRGWGGEEEDRGEGGEEEGGEKAGGGGGGGGREEGGGGGRGGGEWAGGEWAGGGREGTGGKWERGKRGTVYNHKNVLSVKSHDGHKTSPKFERGRGEGERRNMLSYQKSHDFTCTCPLYLPAIGTPAEVPEHTTTFFCTPQCCNLQD